MTKRARILVVDTDLHTLSKTYLFLLHKNHKVEASNNPAELQMRRERFKPVVVILNLPLTSLSMEMIDDLSRSRAHVIYYREKAEDIRLPIRKLELMDKPLDLGALEYKMMELFPTL